MPQFVNSVSIGLKIFVTAVPFFHPLRPPFPPHRPDCSIPSGGHLSQLKRPLLTLRQELLAPIFQHLHLGGHIPCRSLCLLYIDRLITVFLTICQQCHTPSFTITPLQSFTPLQAHLTQLCIPSSESEKLNMVTTSVHCCHMSSNIIPSMPFKKSHK